MEDSLGIDERSNVAVALRTSSELVHLIKKLRWAGMEEEALRIQILLRGVDPAATLLAGPWDTD